MLQHLVPALRFLFVVDIISRFAGKYKPLAEIKRVWIEDYALPIALVLTMSSFVCILIVGRRKSFPPCKGLSTWRRTRVLPKGGGAMTTYEAIIIMIAFGMFVIALLNARK